MYKEFVIHMVTFLKDGINNKLWICCNSGLVTSRSASLLFRLSTITNLRKNQNSRYTDTLK